MHCESSISFIIYTNDIWGYHSSHLRQSRQLNKNPRYNWENLCYDTELNTLKFGQWKATYFENLVGEKCLKSFEVTKFFLIKFFLTKFFPTKSFPTKINFLIRYRDIYWSGSMIHEQFVKLCVSKVFERNEQMLLKQHGHAWSM